MSQILDSYVTTPDGEMLDIERLETAFSRGETVNLFCECVIQDGWRSNGINLIASLNGSDVITISFDNEGGGKSKNVDLKNLLKHGKNALRLRAGLVAATVRMTLEIGGRKAIDVTYTGHSVGTHIDNTWELDR